MLLSSSVSFFLFFIFRKFLASRKFSPKSFLRFLVFQTLVSYKVVSYNKKNSGETFCLIQSQEKQNSQEHLRAL